MNKDAFPEKLSRFLTERLQELRAQYGETSPSYLGLARQYLKDLREDVATDEQNVKHYEAGITALEDADDHVLPGLERLYRRALVIEPTLVCIAHCRYCLRSNYPKHTLTEQQIVDVAKYCGNEANRPYVNEVLITGGDPLLIPRRLELLLQSLIEHAPNVRIARIATRIPTQDPAGIDDDVLGLFRDKPSLRFELATQVNHPVEFCPETAAAFRSIQAAGVTIYSQNVLLKGVNDDLPTLIDLYDNMRQLGIEAHYLFHAVPLKGTHHLRTSVDKGIRLARSLTSCGAISGRAKPMFAAMTDIGKVTLYEGTIADRQEGRLLLRSSYTLEDRLAWNPSWRVPASATVSEDGYLSVWYVDGAE